jgi:heme exporter protein B
MAIMMQSLWKRQLYREWLIVSRNKQSLLNTMMFFMMFIGFFPLSLPYSSVTLRFICPGVIFLALTFSVFLSAERFYQEDVQTGWTEQWLVHQKPLLLYVYTKFLVHGVVILIGILLTIPFIGLFYQIDWFNCVEIFLIICFALPTLIALCSLVSAFGSYGPNRSLLMLLILFPLLLPLIILGSGAITASLNQMAISGYLALLLALSISMVFILGFASAQILKICLEYA